MVSNVEPVFPRTPRCQIVAPIAAALSAANLTGGTLGTNVFEVLTGPATDGCWAYGVSVKPQPTVNTVAAVARFYLNNGSTIATAANSAMIGELQLPATTASTTAPQSDWWFPIDRALAPGYRVLMVISVYSTGAFEAIGWAGEYPA